MSWKSYMKKVFSCNNTKSEYHAMALACAKIIWLHSLLNDILVSLPHLPIFLIDNIDAKELAHNPIFHARTKHI